MDEDETTVPPNGARSRSGTPAEPSGGAEPDEEDWERRVADFASGRRSAPVGGIADAASPPASYEPDPAVYDVTSTPLDEPPRRRRFGRRGGSDDPPPAPRHAAAVVRTPGIDAPAGVATWTPDADPFTSNSVVEQEHTAEPAPAPEPEPPAEDGVPDEPGPTGAARGGRRGIASRLRSRFAPAEDTEDDDEPFLAPVDDRAPAGAQSPAPAPATTRPRPGPRPGSRPRPGPRPGPEPRPEAAAPTAETADAPADRPRPRPRPGPAAPDAEPDTPADETAPTAMSAEDDDDLATEGPPRPPLRERLRASRASRFVTKLVILAVVVGAAALLLRTYVVAPYYIPSQSMEPTLHGCPGCNNDHVLVDKLSYRFHHPHAGDIVVFDKPPNLNLPDPVLIKRVIGVGGDKLVLKHGDVYVNGQRVSEPYIDKACPANPSRPETGRSTWLIPNNDVFVMGDNRCNSTDSRTFGPIKDSSIIGRAFVIVWPLKRFTFL